MKNGRPKKFRVRIIGYAKKPAQAFRFNPLNWRQHGTAQLEALHTMLAGVGWVQGVIENKQTGNLIDGHARIQEALEEDPKQPVPYLVVDLTPAEEKAVLATLDPIGALGEVDQPQLDRLHADTVGTMPGLELVFESLAGEVVEMLRSDERFMPREYDERISSEVEFLACPKCGIEFPI